MRWFGLLFWLIVCFAVAAIGSHWNINEIPGWYRKLVRPAIAPPNWVFAPVWTLLYALMAIAAWRIWLAEPSTSRSWSLGLFLLQLALNLAWSWIFFTRHAIGAALAELVVLWLAIAATILSFSQVAPAAAWLLVPYLAWVTFASILNAAFWRLN